MLRYEEAIREHIDGSYLRHDLSEKHDWTDSTWACIDWYTHERHLKALKRACLFQRLKFIHGWQPTNSQKPMSRSGSVLAVRQLWKTMITFSDALPKIALDIWR